MGLLPPVEISDLIRASGPDGQPMPVRAAEVVERLRESGQHRAARIVARMPTRDGNISREYADDLIVRVHYEIQRLAEELQQGRRVADELSGQVGEIIDRHGTAHIVDVGCGIGYLLRWLAIHDPWDGAVELVGVDLDAALVAEATALAREESAAVRFVVGDALVPGVAVTRPECTVVISSGLLHHLPVDRLSGFFAAQAALGIAGFAHWDLMNGRTSILGAWIFHRARMREALSRHDGVWSARRAHSAAVLSAAAATGAPTYQVEVDDDPRFGTSLVDVVRLVRGRRRP